MAERIYVLRDRENEDISEAREPESTRPMAERAREVFGERAERAQDALRRARNQLAGNARTGMERIRRVADERPLHFIAGIAGAAFLLGMALRIWRSKRHG